MRNRKVRNIGAPAWSILAVTFTKKASEEMRVRVREALGEEVSGQVRGGSLSLSLSPALPSSTLSQPQPRNLSFYHRGRCSQPAPSRRRAYDQLMYRRTASKALKSCIRSPLLSRRSPWAPFTASARGCCVGTGTLCRRSSRASTGGSPSSTRRIQKGCSPKSSRTWAVTSKRCA